MRRTDQRGASVFLWTVCLLAACGGDQPPAPAPSAGVQPVLRHDFGVIPHGRAVEQELVLTGHGDWAGHFVRGFSAGCPLCASGTVILERPDGSRTPLVGPPGPEATIQPDQRLLLRLRIDSSVKEAQDMAPLETRGFALLQGPGGEQVEIAVLFTFAIDAPVEVRPFPHVAIGPLARGAKFQQSFVLRGDASHQELRFGPVRASDPALAATLRQDGEETLLDVSYAVPPDRFDGPLPPMTIEVGTDLPDGYVVRLPVSGLVLPRFVVEPAYGIRIDDARRGAESTGFANVIDHDLGAGPGLALLRVRGRQHEDLGQHFEIRLEPVPGMERTTRVHLRYLGTLQDSFFGEIDLCRPGKHVPVVSVEFRGLQR